MELNALPDYLLDDGFLFVELYPTSLVVISKGINAVEDREPKARDMVDCMLAYSNSDLQL